MPASAHTLILNAAEGLLQFVLARREKAAPSGPESLTLLCAETWHAPAQGAELLAPALQQALERLRIGAGHIDRIACVRGPGSFTGLRLVLATAAGLARATGAAQGGIDYLRLLADSAFTRISPCMRMPGILWVLTHARRQLVHMQGFAVESAMRPLTETLACSPEEAARRISAAQGGALCAAKPVVLGSGLTRNRAALENAFARAGADGPVLLSPAYEHPGVDALLQAADTVLYSPADITPLYARPSDAEENIESLARNLGLDPAAARQRLAALTGRAARQ